MSTSGGGSSNKELQAQAFMLALVDRAMEVLREALRAGRPAGVAREAVKIHRDNENDTKATAAAFLSAWTSFARNLDDAADSPESLTLPELTARLIHRTYLRKRRKDYRDRQMADQVERANVRGNDGRYLPFDPQDPIEQNELMKNLPDEIASVLSGWSVRDRMVLELWLDREHTYEKIVEAIKTALPGQPISTATVQRIVERFCDEMRGRLDGE